MILDFVRTILAAGAITLLLAFASLVVAILLGLGAALCKVSRHRTLAAVAGIYTFVVRGIPDLVMMLLVFYSLPSFIGQVAEWLGFDIQVEFSPLGAGIATLGLIFGAYMTETFKSALLNIPRGQIEAGLALGLRPTQIFRHVVLKPALRTVYPAMTSQFIFLMLTSSIASSITAAELTHVGAELEAVTFRSFEIYFTIAGLYLAMSFGLSKLSTLIRRICFAYPAG